MTNYLPMPLFRKNRSANSKLEREVSGLVFRNPLGSSSGFKSASFIVTTPPKDNVIAWLSGIKQRHPNHIVVVDIAEDFQRLFSLSYDFADLLVIDPDRDGGINALDISDTVNLLDSLLALRLCYEKYTPVYLTISNKVTPEELQTLLSYCRLSGIDGIVAQGIAMTKAIREQSNGRMPVFGSTKDPEEAIQMLSAGASIVELDTNPLVFKKTLKSLEK